MVLMAIDHVRVYSGVPAGGPDPAVFFTRWVTHFCAPVFFLLTGTGAYLSLARKTPAELSRFLFTRGLWLIFLEIVVMRCFAYQFNFDFKVTLLLVLWALGWSMITLSVLVRFPAYVAAIFGIVMIAGHNLLDGINSTNPLWVMLHSPGFLLTSPGPVVLAMYSLIPWVGVTAVGYALGQVYRWSAERRRAFLLQTGMGLSVAFLIIRFINVYGDPAPWSSQPTALFTVLSFGNTTKYPPSLLFLLMTLGPALVLLYAIDRHTPRWMRPALVFGKVPLFYYMLHFAFIHLLAVVTCLVRYGTAHWMFESPDLANYPFVTPPGWGYSLPVVYAVWMLVVLVMYPLCRWFAALKQRRSDWWLSYL